MCRNVSESAELLVEPTAVTKFQGNPLIWGVNTKYVNNVATICDLPAFKIK